MPMVEDHQLFGGQSIEEGKPFFKIPRRGSLADRWLNGQCSHGHPEPNDQLNYQKALEQAQASH